MLDASLRLAKLYVAAARDLDAGLAAAAHINVAQAKAATLASLQQQRAALTN